MKENTVKLSGHSKDRFLERFFAEESGLEPEVRQRLTTRARSAFTSLRVRKAVLAAQRSPGVVRTPQPPSPVAPRMPQASTPPPAPDAAATTAPAPIAAPPSPPASADSDPFAVKLVPVFQREGREGLLVQLAAISDVEHLRRIAKAQQIVLPQTLRSGDAAPDTVREAIADAVARRIADRRAAAG